MRIHGFFPAKVALSLAFAFASPLTCQLRMNRKFVVRIALICESLNKTRGVLTLDYGGRYYSSFVREFCCSESGTEWLREASNV